ncbi:MAG: hypothetical protein A2487_14880 [Candidatus Raymondbacteria bacterium RifOxyC12_full_50_8]|uniref:Histidine kinase/HSP90-like ATPase domain-containing protein n=1 Tax=Candidatus Raymondbacteria bacterium RIFOXYD12_FULL_49_13 TaxID=1817890 RepID=A0A1F7FMC4_UNCRA|nr:MAG: hypothetical protein A2248_15820 [Candidatus Raymondbacteria bacterium RIFOXYA2_FULL_49_16]OGJ96085.1 MAG: hypothetical protein A2453_08360 [Candidatus Raymondbacteria bacterium RIFOXYC2_FULL_50_21]OGK01441.1 MAG: hypothetical protein A2487_14880 [Candidatus Raymondbacteria bacterium RifOxyC12_full_50_8]OGK01856.1 MAG: hypothetical protein A2350_00830 [Candidatus Raymondbacteria bacterium RifOxyB12_full_50_8]OGK07622.1 MAG: hypothetical protein A2519_21905 [Candidatus Raymondbacteria ba
MAPIVSNPVMVDFPGDIDYIPLVRKFFANLINAHDFSRRFAFRTEIIIDELCNNTIKFGKPRIGESIKLSCDIQNDQIVLDIFSPRSMGVDIIKLKKAVEEKSGQKVAYESELERGIHIIKILCDDIQVFDKDDICIRVIKKREQGEEFVSLS